MPIQKENAFILRTIDFRSSSKIVTLFSEGAGKITGLCKGIRAGKKNFTTPLDIFSLNEVIYYESRAEVWLVSSADLIDPFSLVRADLEKNCVACYMMEIVDKIMPVHLPAVDVFGLVHEALRFLRDHHFTNMLYIFQAKILELSGFKPSLHQCLHCNSEIVRQGYFSVRKGGLLCVQCFSVDRSARLLAGEIISCLRYIQQHSFPMALRLKLSLPAAGVIRDVLEEFLHYHLNTRLKSTSSVYPR